MEITTICVCIVVWLVLVVASILSAAFFSLIDNNNNETGYMITLLWCTLGLAISITHILVMKGVI